MSINEPDNNIRRQESQQSYRSTRRYSLFNTSPSNSQGSSPFTGLFRSTVSQTIDELSENAANSISRMPFGRRNTIIDAMAGSSGTFCQNCKRIEVDLTNASDSLTATDAELKASRQVISLLQRQLELIRIEKEGLEKIIANCQFNDKDDTGFAQYSDQAGLTPELLINTDDDSDASSKYTKSNLLNLIKTQLYAKDEEIVKLKYNLKQTQNEKEQLMLEKHSSDEEIDRLKGEISVLKENLALRDQTIVSLSNEVFEQGNPPDYAANQQRRQSSAEALGYQKNHIKTERQIARFIDTIDAYKKTNELLSDNVIKLTDRCAMVEKRELDARSQSQELEAKCCQIQSKLLSLLKEIEQASKPSISDQSVVENEEVICSESVRLLIKRLLEDESLNIPLSWKEGNKSKCSADDEDLPSSFKYECDELGFYITAKEGSEIADPSTSGETSNRIGSLLTRRNRMVDNLTNSIPQLSVVEEAIEATELEAKQTKANKLKFAQQISVDAWKTDEVEWRHAWDEFIKDFDDTDLAKSSRFKALLRCGVPQEYRCKVWKAIVDLKMGAERQQYGPDYYQSLLEPNRPPIDKSSTNKLNPSSKQIELDLLRTLPNNKYFETLDSSGTVRLRRVLTAYSEHDPKVGYCQGMNRLAAVALLVLPEEEAFWCLKAIVDKIMPLGYYNDLWLAQVDSNVVMDFVALKMPQLGEHFRQNGIELSLFAWFLTIFVDGTPPAFFLRLWDSFLYEGDKILFRVALALLKIHENQLLKFNNSVSVNNFLRLAVNKPMNMDHFFEIAFEGMNPFSGRALRTKRQQNFQALRAGLQSFAKAPSPTSSLADDDNSRSRHDESPNEDSSIISI